VELIDFFDRGASDHPERACFVFGEQSWSYAETRHLTMRIASAFRDHGIAPGAHVAVISSGDPLAFICVLGALRAQMVWLPVIERETSEEIAQKLEFLDCECLFYESAHAETAALIHERLPGLKTLVCIDGGGQTAPTLDTWIAEAGDEFEIDPADPNDIAILMSTSGTTGQSKGVPRSHLDIEIQVATALSSVTLDEAPRYLITSSLTFTGWNTFRYFTHAGTCFVLQDPGPLEIARAVEEHRITDLALAVTRVYMMLAEPLVRECDFSSLQHFAYNTAPMSEAKLRDAIDVFGPIMMGGYGSTEILAHAVHLSAEDHFQDGQLVSDDRLRSCGRATPFVKLAIMDEDGRVLGANQLGELVVRGTSIMKGYYKNPSASAEALRFGWLHTGDAAYRDEDGFFYVVDRLADLITTRDARVAPSEIERVLWAHPSIRDCAVVGIPSSDGVDEITAVVELRDGSEMDEPGLIEACRERLGADKTPKAIYVWDELPRSPRAKVLKRVIRTQLMSTNT
jgi:acyl-CoA synthetase (AMP-forming)/AMP-acid ligase II